MMKRLALLLLFLTFASQGFGQVQMDRINPKGINGTVYAGNFSGATIATQVINAVSVCGNPGCVVVLAPTLGSGTWGVPANNVIILDQRWTNDQGLGEGALPNQHSHIHYDFHAGANDSYESGTFSGPAGFAVEGFADAGGFGSSDSTARAFLVSGFFGATRGTGSTRPVTPLNVNVSCNEASAITPTCEGLEIDINRHASNDTAKSYGLNIVSGDLFSPSDFIFTASTNTSGNPSHLLNGQAFKTVGLWLHNYTAGADVIRIIPAANDNNFAFRLRNTTDAADVTTLDDSGNFTTNGLIGIKTGGPGWFTSGAAAPATLGLLRLGTGDGIDWRNNGNTGNLPLVPNSSDQLTYNGNLVPYAGAPGTVAGLPTCNATTRDTWQVVTDANAPAYNATVSGGGAVRIPVYCNGTNWTAH